MQLQIIRDFLRQWGPLILAGWRTIAKQEKALRYELDVKLQTLVTEKKGKGKYGVYVIASVPVVYSK